MVDTDKKYIVTCEKHNVMVSTDSIQDARKMRTKDFCGDCK